MYNFQNLKFSPHYVGYYSKFNLDNVWQKFNCVLGRLTDD